MIITRHPFLSLLIGLGFFGAPYHARAQQLPPQQGTLFQGMLWNPALTAPTESWEAGMMYSQQWVSFPGAPVSLHAYAQVPWEDKNMAGGISFSTDRTGPFQAALGQLTYAYRLTPGLYRKDRLSLGIAAKAGQLRFDPNAVTARDQGDQLIEGMPNSALRYNAAFGLFYISHNTFDFDQNAFYFGAVADNLLRQRLGEEGRPSYSDRFHWRMHGGYRIIWYSHCYEPAVYMDMSLPGKPRIGGIFRYELQQTLWGLAGMETTGNLRLGGGWIFVPSSFSSGQLMLGADLEYDPFEAGSALGVNYRFYLAWKSK